MECFICRKKFGSLQTLILHFKKLHDIRTESFIRCCDCIQSFQGLFRFKRHVNRHHINTSNELPQVCENVQNSRSCSNIENSKLDNVFLAATFKSRDIKSLGIF